METNVGDKKAKNIPKRIVGDVKSFINGLAIGVVISIIGGLAYGQIWQLPSIPKSSHQLTKSQNVQPTGR